MSRTVDSTRLLQHAGLAAALSAATAAPLQLGLMAWYGNGSLHGYFALYGASIGLLVGPAIALRERTRWWAPPRPWVWNPLLALLTILGCYAAYLQYRWLGERFVADAVSAFGIVLATEAEIFDPIATALFFAPPAFAITWAVVRRDLEPDLRAATLRGLVATALFSLVSVTFYDFHLLGGFEPGSFWVPWWVDARGNWAAELGALGVALAACLPALLALTERWVPLEGAGEEPEALPH